MGTRVKSKVEVVPALPRGTESKKSAFSGVRPPPIQVSNNNVIRVKQGTNDRKPLNTNSANRGRRIDLLVGGKVRSTLAEWREEVIENNNTEEKKEKDGQEEKKRRDDQEEKTGRDDQEEKENLEEVYPRTTEELKEEKRREQYRRIQEFKRKKSEEKSIMKKRRLEEGRLGKTKGEVNMTQELFNPGGLGKVEIGDERKSKIKRRDDTGQSSSSMNKNEAPSPTVKKEDFAKAKTGREGGIQIRTDLMKSKEVREVDNVKKNDDIPSSLTLAATLAGLEDLFAEDSSHVNPQEDLVSKVFQNSIKNQHSQSRPATPLLAPTTPQNILVSDPGTDLLQAAMRETFSSDLQNLQMGASDLNIKQEKAVNINKETSPCKNANDYSIKQEMMDEASLLNSQAHGANSLDYNIKKEPLDSSTAAKELAGFFSDFGVAVVKSESEVVEEVPYNLGIEDNDGEVFD